MFRYAFHVERALALDNSLHAILK